MSYIAPNFFSLPSLKTGNGESRGSKASFHLIIHGDPTPPLPACHLSLLLWMLQPLCFSYQLPLYLAIKQL